MIPIRTYIYKRKHRSGAVSWMVRWKDQKTGLWKAITGGRTQDEAKIIEMRARDALLKGEDPGPTKYAEPLLVKDVIEQFYKGPRYLTVSIGWQKEFQQKLEKVLLPQFGECLFSDLTREKLLNFYINLKKTHKLTNQTIRYYHYLLCLLGDLYTEQVSDSENLVRKIKDFSKLFPLASSSRDINFLTCEEINKLLKEASRSISPLLYPFIKFLAHTGLRRSEALNLKWIDIDINAGFIHIRKSKGGKARIIPLEKEALEAIKDLSRTNEFVFTTKDGKKYYKDSFLKPLKRAVKRAGIIKRVDLHTLRHSYGSNKIRQGWGLKKVSMILGHSDIGITSKIYTHLLDGDLKVRDDFTFDRNIDLNNSFNVEESTNMSQMTADFRKKLEKIPFKILNKNYIQIVVNEAIKLHLEENNQIQSDSPKPSKNYGPATLMLRRYQEDPSNLNQTHYSDLRKNSDFNDLTNLQGSAPGRARTCDLQIRSLTL